MYISAVDVRVRCSHLIDLLPQVWVPCISTLRFSYSFQATHPFLSLRIDRINHVLILQEQILQEQQLLAESSNQAIKQEAALIPRPCLEQEPQIVTHQHRL